MGFFVSFKIRRCGIGSGRCSILTIPNDSSISFQEAKRIEGLNNALLKSAEFGDFDAAKKLLKDGANVNARNRYGDTVLMTSIHYGNVDFALRLLKEFKQDVNIASTSCETALSKAVQLGSAPLVRECIRAGADVNMKNMSFCSPFHLSCAKGDIEIAKMLIGAGADVFEKNNDDEGAVTIAAHYKHKHMIRFLIEDVGDGMSVEECGMYSRTPLARAITYNRLDMARFLVEEMGADLNAKARDSETSLSLLFSRWDCPYDIASDFLKYLKKTGKPIVNPLKCVLGAAKNGRLDLINLLKEYGIVLDGSTKEGRDALLRCIWFKDFAKYVSLVFCNALEGIELPLLIERIETSNGGAASPYGIKGAFALVSALCLPSKTYPLFERFISGDVTAMINFFMENHEKYCHFLSSEKLISSFAHWNTGQLTPEHVKSKKLVQVLLECCDSNREAALNFVKNQVGHGLQFWVEQNVPGADILMARMTAAVSMRKESGNGDDDIDCSGFMAF